MQHDEAQNHRETSKPRKNNNKASLIDAPYEQNGSLVDAVGVDWEWERKALRFGVVCETKWAKFVQKRATCQNSKKQRRWGDGSVDSTNGQIKGGRSLWKWNKAQLQPWLTIHVHFVWYHRRSPSCSVWTHPWIIKLVHDWTPTDWLVVRDNNNYILDPFRAVW